MAEARVAGGSEVCDRAAQEAAARRERRQRRQRRQRLAASRASAGLRVRRRAKNLCVITRERDGNLANGRETIDRRRAPVRRPERRPRRAAQSEAPKSVRREHLPEGQGPEVPRPRHQAGPTASPAPTAPDVIFALGGNDQRQRRPRQRLHRGRQGQRPPRRRPGQGHPDRRQGRRQPRRQLRAPTRLLGGSGRDFDQQPPTAATSVNGGKGDGRDQRRDGRPRRAA